MSKNLNLILTIAAVISSASAAQADGQPVVAVCPMDKPPTPICKVWGVGPDLIDSDNTIPAMDENVSYAEAIGDDQPAAATLGECLALAKSMLGKTVYRSVGTDHQMIRVVETLVDFRSAKGLEKTSASLEPRGIVLRKVTNEAIGVAAVLPESVVAASEADVEQALASVGATKQVHVRGKFRAKKDRIVVRATAVFARD